MEVALTMPLFELEEGEHHKFYRVELDGNRVELHWGRIGTDGQRKTLAFDGPGDARRAYEQELARRRERGYSRVYDEAEPHDADEAAQRRLAASGPLTKYPRFVFRKGNRLTWIEVRGAVLVTASGVKGATTAPAPTERTCASEQAALRERDQLMAALVRDGYELEAFGAKEKPAAQRRGPPLGALKSHPELEAQLAADPDDAGTWMVYEDWLLAQRDPRSALIEREHAGEHKDAAIERGKLGKLLLGTRADTLMKHVTISRTRAGYILACELRAAANAASLLAALLVTPAARYLVELELSVGDYGVLDQLAAAPLLRSLAIGPEEGGSFAVDAKVFAPLAHLARLHVDNLYELTPHACLSRLRSIRLSFSNVSDFGVLARPHLDRVDTLAIRLSDTPTCSTDRLPATLPALRDLELHTYGVAATLIDALLATGLVPQLRRLRIVDRTLVRAVTAAERATLRDGAFASVDVLELPVSLVGTARP